MCASTSTALVASTGHFDGYFAYHVRCPKCGAIYEMGTQVIVKRRDDLTPESPSVQTLEVDTDE